MALSFAESSFRAQSQFEQDALWVAPTYARAEVCIVDGRGSWVTAADGRRYLDFVSGIAVNALGHCHPAIIKAVEEQIHSFSHISNLYPNGPQIALAQRMLELSGWGARGGKVFFCNSGTEANEGALKFARKYFDRTGQGQRTQVITFLDSFHGRTYGALAATGQPALKQGFGPMPEGFLHLPWNDCAALRNAVTAETCAILLEPIAAEGGILLPSPEFIATINELRQQTGCLVIADEIQTGLGRCGSLEGAERYGLQVDMSTWAKALGGGLPLGMILLSAPVAAQLKPGDHGTTFGGNPVSCAAGLAALEILGTPEFKVAIAERSQQLRAGLQGFSDTYPWLGEVRGDGLLMGIVTEKPVGDLVAACRAQGLLVHRAGSNVLRLLPPLNVSSEEIETALQRLKQALAAL